MCPKISEVGSKQIGTKLLNDLIMILINRSAVVRSAVNLLPKVEGKHSHETPDVAFRYTNVMKLPSQKRCEIFTDGNTAVL